MIIELNPYDVSGSGGGIGIVRFGFWKPKK